MKKKEVLIGDRTYKINVDTFEEELKIGRISNLVNEKMNYLKDKFGTKDLIDILSMTCIELAGIVDENRINEIEVSKELEGIKNILESINK